MLFRNFLVNLLEIIKKMLQLIKTYLKFLWNSKNEHGVHSPFVYDLVTKCFYDQKKHPEYLILKEFYNKNKISKNAKISLNRTKLLFRIVNYFKPETILEITKASGAAQLAISLGNSKVKITTLKDINKLQKVKLIYFETNNSQKNTIEQFELLLKSVTNQTVWIFNNIHQSIKAEIDWKIIQNHPKVTVTIDTFKWGIVFFRTEQEKEHFTIRI